MALHGNKGEWSEIYAFLKLLGEGKVFAGDQDLNKIQNLFFPIIAILRKEKEGSFKYELKEREIIIQKSDGTELLKTSAESFLNAAEQLINSINKNKRPSFSLPDFETFLNSIYCHSLKAKSSDKADIRIVLHDCRNNITSEMGFSIKSQLGGDPTLLNASKATNFNFKIKGGDFSDEVITEINTLNPKRNKISERIKAIKARGGKLQFDKIDNPTFRNNLIMLDGDLPAIIAHLMLKRFDTGISTLKELTEEIQKDNPLKYDITQHSPFYEYKIKHLLISVVLGMMPATAWNGRYDANGGYLVVKKDGEVLCYHFYDRNLFGDYIFANTRLDSPSVSRHEYASIIKESDDTLSFKLNPQIRLK